MKLIYKVIPGSIASVMYIEEYVEGALSHRMTAVYLSERRPPSVQTSGLMTNAAPRNWWGLLPKPVEVLVQERFDELFDAPYEYRQAILDQTSMQAFEFTLENH